MPDHDVDGGPEPIAPVIWLNRLPGSPCPHAWRKGYYEGSQAALKCFLCGAEAEER